MHCHTSHVLHDVQKQHPGRVHGRNQHIVYLQKENVFNNRQNATGLETKRNPLGDKSHFHGFKDCLGKGIFILMSYVPLLDEVHDFFASLPRMIISKLCTSNCLLLEGQNEKWVLPYWDIVLSDSLAKALGIKSFGPKISVKMLSSLCHTKYGLPTMGYKWLSSRLNELHSVSIQNTDAFKGGYDVMNTIRKMPFIPLLGGYYSLIEVEHEIVKAHVLPAICDKKNIVNTDLIREYLSSIMVHLQSNCSKCGTEWKDIISEVYNKAYILTNHGFVPPSEVEIYFGNDFGNQFDICRFISGIDVKSMRVNEYSTNGALDARKQQFNKWVLDVGDRTLPAKKEKDEDEEMWIEILEEFIINSTHSPIEKIMKETFPDFATRKIPSDAKAPLEDQPLPVDASPTTASPGYVAGSDPDEDPEDDPEDDHADYPVDGGDDDDEPYDDNDDDDEDEEPFKDEEDDEEEEEHLAPADSSVVPIVDLVLPAEDIEALEADEPAPTPKSPYTIIPLSQTRLLSSPPLPLPSPLTTSPTDIGAPLGYRAAGIRMRALLSSTSRRTDILGADVPPRKRACLITPAPGFEVEESSVASAARKPGPTESNLRRCRVDQTGYGIIDTWDEIVDTLMEIAPTTLEGDDRALLRARVNTLFRDRPDHHRTAMLLDKEAMYACEAWASSEDKSAAIVAYVRTLEVQVVALITQTSSLQTQLTTTLGHIEILEARDPEPQEGPTEAGSSFKQECHRSKNVNILPVDLRLVIVIEAGSKDRPPMLAPDFGNGWERHLPLVEFSYNNSYHASIKAAPFEALYGRKCRSPVCWAEVGDAQLTGPEIIQETTEKIVQIKQRLQAARDRQKSYADIRRKPLEFQVGDKVMLKQLSRVHSTFHVSNLKKCLSDEPLAIPLDELHIDDKLRFVEESVEIMDRETLILLRTILEVLQIGIMSQGYREPGDGDDEPYDDDDDDDGDEEPFKDEEDDEEEEEHLALADSSVVPIVDLVLPTEDTEALEADDPAPTPKSPHTIIPLSQTRLRIARKTVRRKPPMIDIPEADVPPRKRACLTTPAPGFEVGESSVAGDARQPGPTESNLRRCRVEQTGYGIIDTWDEIVDTLMEIAPTTLEGDDRALLRARVNTLFKDRPDHCRTAMVLDREAMYAREACEGSEDRSAAIVAHVRTLEALIDRGVAAALAKRDANRSRNGDNKNDSGTGGRRQVTTQRECTYTDFLKCLPMSFQGSALTWYYSYIRAVGQDVAYAMPWAALKRMISDKYCPRGEIQNLESEYWNLKVKGLGLLNYNQRFQELALMCDRMFPEESAKVERYIGGLPDMIRGSVKASKPQSMQEAIEFATEMMDKKMLTHAERQAEHKRKFDDTSRNNQHQHQPFKRNNVTRAGPGDKKPYGRTKPLCRPAATNNNNNNNTNNNNQRAQRANARGITCFECGVQGHYKSDCLKLKNGNHGNQAGNRNAVAKAYAIGTAGTNPNSNVVTSTFLLNNRYALILFDTGADKSFISTAFSSLIDIIPITLDHGYDVKLANGRIIWVNTLIRGYTLNFLNHPFNIDVIPVEMGSFDVIIGTDWLVKHYAVIVCDEKLVRVPFNNEILIFHGDESNNGHESRLNIISCTKTQKNLLKGCHVFLAHITTKGAEDKSKEKRLEDVPIVQDFPEDLSAPYEMKELSNQLKELSDKGFIRPSSSPWGAPVLFVKKRSFWMFIDYQELNKPTMKNRYPLSRIDDLFHQLQGLIVYSKIDLRSGYHQLRVCHGIHVDPAKIESIKDWASPKTAMEIRQFLGDKQEAAFQLIKQKLCSAPILALSEESKDFVVYCDASIKGENDTMWVVVDRLTKSAHFLPMKETDPMDKLARLYLKEVVTRHGIPVSIICYRNPRLTSNFWKSFQKAMGTRLDMSTAYHPQTDGKSERTIQTLEDMLRACVIDFGNGWERHLPLIEFSYNNSYHASIKAAPFEASEVSITREFLSSPGNVKISFGRTARSTSFLQDRSSVGLSPALIFMDPMNQICKPYIDKFVIVFIDDILIYFKYKEEHEVHLRFVFELLKKEKLYAKFSKCEFWLQEVHFFGHVVNQNGIYVDLSKIEAVNNWKAPTTLSGIRSFYRCKANLVADALSRKERVKPRRVRAMAMSIQSGVKGMILAAQSEVFKQENVLGERLYGLDQQIKRKEDENLYFMDRIWVTLVGGARTIIIDEAYTTKYSIHLGADKMYHDLRDMYWWPGMKRDIATYVSKCLTCLKVKAEHQRPLDLLQQPEIPEWKWDKITMDFITKLRKTKSRHDTIWVIVDRLTKSAYFLVMRKDYSTHRLAKLYIDEIVTQHGVPVSMISDRDGLFTSRCWQTVQKALGTRLDMSTGYHPQTDRQNEFPYNNSHHSSIRCAPFEALYGRKCRSCVLWAEIGKSSLIGPELLQETTDKVVLIKKKLKATRDRQKSYADNRRKPLEFEVRDRVLLKVSP
uniref:Putative reverse transcriptase domain-containing protein n=1 Tax=Tanacetum cinerariifolium TaxID=118510 RepID=A0A6L2MDL6_TANCI|nr:putative reverse transcriptase domain-containing protein [Tanacetum cinerariifolium]